MQSELKTYIYEKLGPAEVKALLQRPRVDFTSILNIVSAAANTSKLSA